LLAVQAAAAAAVGADERWASGRWTPHVSLALRLDAEQRDAALHILQKGQEQLQIDGMWTAARRYDTIMRTIVPLTR
jgi:hypothetical protein